MNKRPTFIHGIASSQAIDTAGEIVDLKGMDISSLVGGAISWEHEQGIKTPAQIVGKILEAHKIFSISDCSNDHHKHFWNKCKTPFLYIVARLFDDKKPSAIEVASLFQDDAEHPNEPPIIGFSIEGAKISKEGMVVNRSIARKCTATVIPANKTCVAELMPSPKEHKENKENSIESLFKGEMELFKFEPTYEEILEKKEELKPLMKPYTSEAQRRWAHTAAGKEALGGEAGVHEWDEATKGKKLPEKVSKSKDLKKGLPATGVGAGYEPSTGGGQGGGASGGGAFIGSQLAMSEKKDLKKALTAGSMNAAPSQLVGGAALGKEELKKDTAPPVPTPSPSPAPMTAAGIQSGFNGALGLGSLKKKEKSHWYERADQAYNTWDKKNQFKDYMKKRMPHLAEGEIDSIGRVLALKKTVQAEGKLSKMYASYFNKSELEKAETGHVKGVHKPFNHPEHGGLGTSLAGASNASGDYGEQIGKPSAVSEHRRVLGEMKRMPKPNLPKSEEMSKAYEPDPATAKKSGYHPTKPGTEYIHGLPKGHPSLGEHKGHTFRKLSPPTKDHNFHTWAVKTPKGQNYKVNLPAHTGGSRDSIHEHINARTK